MGLVAYWKLSDTSDSSGNGHTLTDVGGVTFAAGKLGNAVTTAVGKYLTVPSSADFNFGTDPFTIAFWIKTTVTGNKVMGLDADGWIDLGCWGFYFATDKVRLDWTGGNVLSGTAVNDGNWHRCVLVREGTGANETKWYIDGGAPTTGTCAYNFNGSNGTCWIMANLDAGWLTCSYDDYQIWKGTAWSAADVATDWNSGTGREYPWTPTTLQLQIGDAWKQLGGYPQINIGDAWKTIAGMQINIGDAWKTIF